MYLSSLWQSLSLLEVVVIVLVIVVVVVVAQATQVHIKFPLPEFSMTVLPLCHRYEKPVLEKKSGRLKLPNLKECEDLTTEE